MQFNLGKLFNELVEGVILYAYRHIETFYIAARHPFWGPPYLALLHARKPGIVSPHTFFLVNVFPAFLLLNYFSFKIRSPREARLDPAEDIVRFTNDMIISLYGGQSLALGPALLRSFLILVLFDVTIRGLMSIVERSRRRRIHRVNSLLYAFGVQPIYLITLYVFVYLIAQCALDATWGPQYVVGIGILFVMIWFCVASLAVRYASIVFGRHLSSSAFIAASAAIMVYVGVTACAIAIGTWSTLDAQSGLKITDLRCSISGGKADVTVVIENNTGRRLVFPTDSAFRVYDMFQINNTDYKIETSLGRLAPLMVLDSGQAFWARFQFHSSDHRESCLLAFGRRPYHVEAERVWNRVE